jgi:hypothetical protein
MLDVPVKIDILELRNIHVAKAGQMRADVTVEIGRKLKTNKQRVRHPSYLMDWG